MGRGGVEAAQGGVVLRRRRGVEAGVGRRGVEVGGSGVEAGGVVLRRRRGVEAGVGRRGVEAGGSGVEAEEGC